MAAYKDEQRGTWYVSFHYYDWTGKNCRKVKRGFKTKREATEWERHFRMKEAADFDMTFEEFVQAYTRDMKLKLKHNTWLTKEHILRTKLLSYFKDKKMRDIRPKDIIQWQNEQISYRDEKGKPYAPTYLKTLQSELSALFNHAFQILYWCGLRVGELLALTPQDIDIDNKVIRITKSYQRLEGEDVITDPKIPKSKRNVSMPDFLCEELKDYIGRLYGILPSDRIFHLTKSFLHHEMTRGAEKAGVKRIRIHDLRHSHISHLIDIGFSAVAIADRVGHESIDITYRYSHLFPSKQVAMADRLDAVNASFEDCEERDGDVDVMSEETVPMIDMDAAAEKIISIDKYKAV